MAITLSITESQIFAAARAFMLGILPDGVEVIQDQDNRVPEPLAPDFVVMCRNLRRRLGTNFQTWDQTNTTPASITLLEPTEITIQLDFHGPNSADFAQIFTTLFRSGYAVDNLAADGIDITPLFAGEPKQVPFINGEQQYENRWSVDAVMQANPVVTIGQDFAAQLVVHLASVDMPGTWPPPPEGAGELGFSDPDQSGLHPAT